MHRDSSPASVFCSAGFLVAWAFIPTALPARIADVRAADPAKTPAASSDAKSDAEKKAEAKPAPVKKPTKLVPENLDDLKSLEAAVKKVVAKSLPATVSVRLGSSFGSGVVVSKDGFVLTAGHVVGEPGRDVEFTFPNGKVAKGKSLGANHGIDSGMLKITDPGEWPFVETGESNELKVGEWMVVLGHPGGYQAGRPPVVRLGRLIQNHKGILCTDAPIAGGDSGGPMFDLDGKVVGIHSHIEGLVTKNYHVAVDTFQATWDRLAKGEEWGEESPRAGGPFLGATIETHEKGCRIAEMRTDSPAAKANLKVDDVILKFDGKDVKNMDELQRLLLTKKPGQEVTVRVLRGSETLDKKITLGKRPDRR